MRSDNIFLRLILVLSLLGILVSGWLLSIHIKFATGQAALTEGCALPGLGGSVGCAHVAISPYSDIFGVPLAAVALGFYFALVLLVFWAMRNYQAALETLYVAFFLSTLSIVVTVVMFAISRFVLQSFCIGCAMLWLINLAIWPCFVKHLGLRWSNALMANLELVRHKALKLKRERIVTSFVVATVCVLLFSVVGTVAKGQQRSESRHVESSILNDFRSASQTFLPAEAMGGPSAKGAVTEQTLPRMEIVKFSDFQCPGCKVAAQFLRPFIMKHGNKVRLTYRNFPLDGSCNPYTPNGRHQMACSSARASICAGQQGKFWEMHDLIFDNQERLSPSVLNELIVKAGLDKEAMDACIKDPATESQLQREIQWGEMIHLQSTPTLVINGRRISGARSPQDLEALLRLVEREAH
jgi:protein-disulfide isomerase/uncharacterized membrane protein